MLISITVGPMLKKLSLTVAMPEIKIESYSFPKQPRIHKYYSLVLTFTTKKHSSDPGRVIFDSTEAAAIKRSKKLRENILQ